MLSRRTIADDNKPRQPAAQEVGRTMKKVKMAISGIGGYGDYCLGLMERFVDPESCELVAAIDPFYEKAPRAEKLREAGVPLFRDLGGILRRKFL